MRYFLVILLGATTVAQLHAQTNLISNPSFENGHEPWKAQGDSHPELDFDKKNSAAFVFEPNKILEGDTVLPCNYWEFGHHQSLVDLDVGVPNNHFGNQSAKEGNAYAGLVSYDPLCIGSAGTKTGHMAIKLSQQLVKGKVYTLKFSVSKMEFGVGTATLSVKVATDRSLKWRPKGKEEEVFREHITNDHTPYNIDWQDETVRFEADENYEYLFIKVVNDLVAFCGRAKGIFIDDISLTDCEDNCTPLKGPIAISSTGFHNKDAPLQINGLGNLSSAFVEILDNSEAVIRSFWLLSPPASFCWDGKTDFGAEAANASYTIKVTAANLCRTEIFSKNFTKYNASTNPTTATPCMDAYFVSSPPTPCCVDEINIQNESITQDQGDPNILYHPRETINTGPMVQVQSGNSVVFKAGESINLRAGTDIHKGAVLCANIESCGSNSIVPSNKEEDERANWDFSQERPVAVGVSEVEDKGRIEVYPNPANGRLSIGSSSRIDEIRLYDQRGRLLRSDVASAMTTSFSLEGLKAGMYILIIRANGEWHQRRIAKMD